MLAGGGLLGTWTLAAWAARRFLPGLPDWRRELLRLADAILPNSHAEAEQLVELLAADPRRVVVIPNGVEDREAYLGGRDDMRAERGHVLYAGRIEPRKNVLGLIQAAAVASLPLLVIGDSVPGFEAYGAFCREAGARNGVRFLPRMEPDDSRLIDAFARARVVALPSWFETPGLAALEGALAGAAVVVTPYGSAREYFGKRALYARPDRPEEIRRALADAWQNGAPSDLAAHVRRSFSWSRIAALTAEVYAR
jgi:glycosyltransferase involved in cell wall biosynthesis